MNFPVQSVLIVDDEPTVRQSIAMMLELQGCEVCQFDSGVSAIDMLALGEKTFDCIILDYSMPELDGMEVLQRLRKMNVTTPVILCSGFSIHAANSVAPVYWPDEELAKPFQFFELCEKIKTACQRN